MARHRYTAQRSIRNLLLRHRLQQPSPPSDWQDHLATLRQGHVINLASIPVACARDRVRWEPTPEGVAIITQTCDLVLPDRPTAHVARVIHLSEQAAKENRNGRRPNLVPLPELGPTFFADLSYISTLDKAVIAEHEARAGVESDDDVRKFGQRVGRRYSRFAFPDDVVPWLEPLRTLAIKRAGRPESPMGLAFDEVASLRLESDNGWVSYPFSLKLCVVIKPGILPPLSDDDEPDLSDELRDWLYGESESILRRDGNAIAKRLIFEAEKLDVGARFWLWSSLAEYWATICKPPKNALPSVQGAIIGNALESDMISTDDFSFERYRTSDEIDLDHLSSPLPI